MQNQVKAEIPVMGPAMKRLKIRKGEMGVKGQKEAW